MSVKLYEIAQAAGVSISTVSRVLNNDKSKPASKATADRIIKIACDLGYYTPARPLPGKYKKNAEHNLVCFLASSSDTFRDHFFSEMLQGIQKEAEAHSYSITHTLSISGTNMDTISSYIDGSQPTGIILMGRISKNVMNFLNANAVNMVYAGLNKLNTNIDQVICDAYSAIVDSVNYLAKCGFTKIGYIGTIPTETSDILNEHRFQAFYDGLKQNQLPFDLAFCRNIVLGTRQGYNATVELIRAGTIPEAFCCGNDNTALGVISALTDYQYRVPEDVSVIGLDDIELAKYMRPRLTTFNVQAAELGKFAVKVLDDRIKGNHTSPILVQFPSTLMIRDSCAVKSTP